MSPFEDFTAAETDDFIKQLNDKIEAVRARVNEESHFRVWQLEMDGWLEAHGSEGES